MEYGTGPRPDRAGRMAALLAAYIGPYARFFRREIAAGCSGRLPVLSFCWPGALFPFAWLCYRRCYRSAGVVALLVAAGEAFLPGLNMIMLLLWMGMSFMGKSWLVYIAVRDIEQMATEQPLDPAPPGFRGDGRDKDDLQRQVALAGRPSLLAGGAGLLVEGAYTLLFYMPGMMPFTFV